MFIAYGNRTTADRVIREKRFKKKKSGNRSWYVVLKHERRFSYYVGNHHVYVLLETYEDDKLAEREVLEHQDFDLNDSAEKAFNKYLERIKNGKLVPSYKFVLGD